MITEIYRSVPARRGDVWFDHRGRPCLLLDAGEPPPGEGWVRAHDALTKPRLRTDHLCGHFNLARCAQVGHLQTIGVAPVGSRWYRRPVDDALTRALAPLRAEAVLRGTPPGEVVGRLDLW